MPQTLRLLFVAVDGAPLQAALQRLHPAHELAVVTADDGAAALEAVATHAVDGVLIDVERASGAVAALPVLAAAAAVLVLAPPPGDATSSGLPPVDGAAEDEREPAPAGRDAPAVASREGAVLRAWCRLGAEDVVSARADPAEVAQRLCLALERKRIELASRRAYATDLPTGLPHRQQLIEHMSQLLALREREPAPMAVVVLRIEGFATTESRLGAAAAAALRRKIAVRLRAAVRASDVVAAVDELSYAVLLGALLTPEDAERVAAKLAQGLMEPFSIGGAAVAVAVAVGIGRFPADATDADALLRKAVGAALDARASGRVGMANFVESGVAPFEAANDD